MKIQKSIESKIRKVLAPSHLEVENESARHRRNPDGETHFRIVVVSEKFAAQSRVNRHRMVNELLEQERELGLHAVTLSALTPAEWEKSQETLSSPSCMTTKEAHKK